MDLFDKFIENTSEGNRRLVSIALKSSPYMLMVQHLKNGDGNKTYNHLVKTILHEIVSQSSSMSKQYMAQLYLLYASTVSANITMSTALDQVDIKQVLKDQDMVWGYNHKTGVWNKVKYALINAGFLGIEIPQTSTHLKTLYDYVKKEKNILTKIETYVTVSYVQTKGLYTQNGAPSNWSSTIIESMKIVNGLYQRMYGVCPGLWWDKLASKQYKNSQETWPATANLQFPTHLTIVCLPLANKDDYDVNLWSSFDAVDNFMDSIVYHIEHCSSCAGIHWINKSGSPRVSPSMASRCWPLMEIRLANMNIGAFMNAKQAEILIDTIQTVLFAWYVCNSAFSHESELYDFHADMINYCNKLNEHHNCAEVYATAIHSFGHNPEFMDRIQKEFINMIGLLMSLLSNLTVLELYLDSEKEIIHHQVRNMCKDKSELENSENDNIIALKEKHKLMRWEPEAVANTVNELLNGYAHNSPCYDSRDKIIAALCFMDVELTQKVLLDWSHGSNIHPFAGLCNDQHWTNICSSDNMNRLSVEYGRAEMRHVARSWTGCMQSKLSGAVFEDAILNVMRIEQKNLRKMQDTMRKQFWDRVNLRGYYFEGVNACLHMYKGNCVMCCSHDIDKNKIAGRYTVLSTKQLRGVTQILTDGDTQIVILDKNNQVYMAANVLIGFKDKNTITCQTCHHTSAIMNLKGSPVGVSCVRIEL